MIHPQPRRTWNSQGGVTPRGFLLGVSAILLPSPVVRHVRHGKALFVKLAGFLSLGILRNRKDLLKIISLQSFLELQVPVIVPNVNVKAN